MIQFLLPVVAFAAILTGCSKKDGSSETAETGTPPSGHQAEPPMVYRLKDFAIHDNNRDGHLGAGDAVFHIHPESFKTSKIDRSSPELKAFLQTLNHHGDRPLRLEGASQYLRIHNWELPDPKGVDWGDPEFTAKNADAQMEAFENAEEFAFENGLEFAGEDYLTDMRQSLESEFSSTCTSLLELSILGYVETGNNDDYRILFSHCEKRAATLDFYFGQNNSSKIAASRPGQQAERESKIYNLKDFVIRDNNLNGNLDAGDEVFQIHPESRDISRIDRSSPELKAFLQTLNHHEDRPLQLEGASQYLRIHNWTIRDIDWGEEFTAKNADAQMEAFENAEEFAFENGLEFAGEDYLTDMEQSLDRQNW